MKTTALLLFSTVIGANAAITMTKDESTFDWIYTQDVDSSSQDLDTNSTEDFFTGNPGEHPVIGGGTATFTSGDFYRTDFGSASLSRANFNTGTDPHTIEITAQMLSTGAASGTLGTMAIFTRDNTGISAIIYIDDAQVSVNDGGTISVLSTLDNTDAFHTFRLARDGAGEFSVWRDDVLLGEEFAAASTGGGNGVFIGDTSGTGNNGDWDLDTMSITTGAFAPVPEPSSTAVLSLGALGLILRRRK